MQREILFRGKLKKSNKFIYGLPTCDFSYIFNSSQVDSCDNYEVIPETIGQFTGLLDKNGTKIFEGDVLKIHHNKEYARPLTCEWDKDNSCFCYVDKEDFEQKYYLNISDLSMDEVIGNIYDNINLINK